MKELVLAEDELEMICSLFPAQGVVLLRGDLASGKTTLVQHFLKFKGYEESVNSPTFSFMQHYKFKNLEIFHYDLYQIGFEGILQNGLFENFFEEGLHLVEWGDDSLEKALKKQGLKVLNIKISSIDEKRKYVIYE
ncbi:tRNA (adenosine(37)-N6)-threonylcarbamoyltransferase complex ATPase subunit type 1 TsaE [Campylobacter sp. MIT 12-5580]|uniref:tRNA (adenosine(37)-N6)-threonylcarbamoyltransferase complex ATPase subunit type 1 TsaE n=1 Tax=Campylobacter sp. MIT 12-5580 TaxID=2040651 RepID=UPI0010F95366|nr:tRNA (adenosine(37)-N6)-threonylcarbamoyltransferase complex ATPase subunit type 1 TsaE [Campylobacter sp. MIT 12-5580]TKX29420.1 tRNA (adenosine(37)-N6)-threonylcarbamoyltransferase complex ATPase subunit type 1 TsaE [Campylobacter sp. MIT 12-5580]